MKVPPIASPAEWQAARDRLLVSEKAHTRASDALAAERRRLPMVDIIKPYLFDGAEGKVTCSICSTDIVNSFCIPSCSPLAFAVGLTPAAKVVHGTPTTLEILAISMRVILPSS